MRSAPLADETLHALLAAGEAHRLGINRGHNAVALSRSLQASAGINVQPKGECFQPGRQGIELMPTMPEQVRISSKSRQCAIGLRFQHPARCVRRSVTGSRTTQ